MWKRHLRTVHLHRWWEIFFEFYKSGWLETSKKKHKSPHVSEQKCKHVQTPQKKYKKTVRMCFFSKQFSSGPSHPNCSGGLDPGLNNLWLPGNIFAPSSSLRPASNESPSDDEEMVFRPRKVTRWNWDNTTREVRLPWFHVWMYKIIMQYLESEIRPSPIGK